MIRSLARFASLLPLLCVAIAYQGALQGGFVWDDHTLIEESAAVHHLSLRAALTQPFFADPLSVSSQSFYRPLVTLTDAADWTIWNGQAFGFHLTNLLLHLAVAYALMALLRRRGASALAASVGASVFALLPRLTESVAWISGRTDLLATLFVLLALTVYSPKADATARRWVAAGLLLLGLLSKEVAIAAVAGMVVLEWKQGRARHLVPVATALGAYFALRLHATGALLSGAPAMALGHRLFAAVAALGEYVRMTVDFARPQVQIGAVAAPSAFGATVGLCALVVAAIAWMRRQGSGAPEEWALATVGASALLLAVHVVPLQIEVLAADRYLYLPNAALTALLTPVTANWLSQRTWRAAAIAVLVPLLAMATARQVSVWSDEHALLTRAVAERAANNTRPLVRLAVFLMDAGLHDRALPYLQQAVSEEGSDAQLATYDDLAVCLDKLGRHEEAIALFSRMVAQHPAVPRPALNRVMAVARAGRWSEATALLEALGPGLLPSKNEQELRQLLDRGRTVFASEASADLNDERARAEVMEALGAWREASDAWATIARRRDAPRELRLRGAGYLALQGDERLAREVLGAIRAELSDDTELPKLERSLSERERLR